MLFIPQEIKDKITALEAENTDLKQKLAGASGKASSPPIIKENKNGGLLAFLAIALVLAIGGLVFLLFFKKEKQITPAEDFQATAYINGKIEKWNPAMREGLVYRVQIGSYENFSLDKYKQSLEGLAQDSIDGMKRLSLGAFSKLSDAQQFQSEMVRLGFESAFVVAYENGTPIALLEAVKKED